MTRWVWTVALLAAFVLLAIGLAPVAHADAALEVEANVTNYEFDSDAVESVTVRIENTGDRPETLVFATWAKQGKRMATWTTADGQRRHSIGPGETRTLELSRRQFTATDQPVMLTVRSADGNRRTHAIYTPEVR